MIMTNYHESFLSKMVALFCRKTITDIISITDEDDDLIDNVVFFEINFHKVIGFYINGSNPYITTNRIGEFDDFNLHELYSELNENKLGVLSPFEIEHMKVFFHPDCDEVIAIYLSSSDFLSSILMIFLVDEIYICSDCSEINLIHIIKENLLQYENTNFLIFQKSQSDSHWTKS